RRHTRFSRDWSSDMCSSDLVPRRAQRLGNDVQRAYPRYYPQELADIADHVAPQAQHALLGGMSQFHPFVSVAHAYAAGRGQIIRSEERRVGKDCRLALSPYL